MRDYRQTNAIPVLGDKERYNDIYVSVTRKHAANIAVANLLYCLAVAVTCGTLYLSLYNRFILLALSIPFTMYVYAKYLIRFTNEARDILFEQYAKQPEVIVRENKQSETDQSYTILPGVKGKIILHIALTESQLEQIKNTALKTKSLTVNYLESLGLSRQNAERLRAELTQHNLLTMDDKGRTHLTNNGRKVFEKLRKSY